MKSAARRMQHAHVVTYKAYTKAETEDEEQKEEEDAVHEERYERRRRRWARIVITTIPVQEGGSQHVGWITSSHAVFVF